MQGGKRRNERTDQGVSMLQRKPFYSYVKMMHYAVCPSLSPVVPTGIRLELNPLRLHFSHHLQSRGNTRGGDSMQQAEVEKSKSADITLSIQRSRKERLTPSGLKEGQT